MHEVTITFSRKKTRVASKVSILSWAARTVQDGPTGPNGVNVLKLVDQAPEEALPDNALTPTIMLLIISKVSDACPI